ncbi:MAG: lamin tail domain-containing protein [Myxococcota bacterium]
MKRLLPAVACALVLAACGESNRDESVAGSNENGGDVGSTENSNNSNQDDQDCSDGERRAGTTLCGLNDRGVIEQACTGGQFVDTLICNDPDECTDDSTRDGSTACGLNERGVFVQDCVAGTFMDGSTCRDPDECVDDETRVGGTACGPAGEGNVAERCVGGEFVADECLYPTPTAEEFVITEIMLDPVSPLTESAGVWIELLNASGETRELGGCEVTYGAASPQALGTRTVGNGGYVVLAGSVSVFENGGIEDAVLLGPGLNAAGDQLTLTCAGAQIDTVDSSSGFPLRPARSLQVDLSTSAMDNDLATSWCTPPLAATYFDNGDSDVTNDHLGTPGESNPACVAEEAVDFCRLQFPMTATVSAGEAIQWFGRFFETGLTV